MLQDSTWGETNTLISGTTDVTQLSHESLAKLTKVRTCTFYHLALNECVRDCLDDVVGGVSISRALGCWIKPSPDLLSYEFTAPYLVFGKFEEKADAFSCYAVGKSA